MSNNSWMGNGMGNWVGNDGGSFDNSGSVLRNTLVGHVLNNSVSIVGVLDGLNSSVGKSNCVASGGGVTIPRLGLLEVSSAVVVIDSVLVSVDWGFGEISSSSVPSGNNWNSGSCGRNGNKS